MKAAFPGVVELMEPARAGLKERKKDLETTLREINHYKSIIGTFRRWAGKIQERRVLNTLEVLPRIGQAIADDLEYRAERFVDLRAQQVTYVRQLNDRIGELMDQPEYDPQAFAEACQKTRSKEREERHAAFTLLTRDFEAWGEQSLHAAVSAEAIDEYERFQQEAKNNLFGCNNVYVSLKTMTERLQRRVDHLTNVLGVHREIILLGRDLVSVRKGLVEIAERGGAVYETVKESYGRMEELMRELQHPRSGFLTGMPSYSPRTLHKVS